MRMHPMRGVSFTVAIGKWAKPHAKIESYTARLCLGFIAFTFYTLDIEEFIKKLIDEGRDGKIKHFDRAHFKAITGAGRKFVYCPVGNICSWSEGDYDHAWCHWCKEYFDKI